MKNVFSSPKTTWAAILGLISLVAAALAAMFDADPATIPNWTIVLAQVPIIIGLLFARDNDKSSEDVGNAVPEAERKPTN